MKKSILILSVIGLALFMTSCLDEGSNNYADTSFVYIDSDDVGNPFGKTFSYYSPARVITSNSMITMQPNRIKILAYSWDEENGTVDIRIDGETIAADNVIISDEMDINHTDLRMMELPEVTEPKSFLEVLPPMYADNKEFMGDYWVFQYGYTATSGKVPHVDFYKRDANNDQGEIAIDINLTFIDNSQSTVTGNRTGYVALNMTPLRYFAEMDETAPDALKIRFYYYVNGTSIPSQNAYELKLVENQQ